jgi:hypothetical protein
MVYLVLSNARYSYADGFWIAASADATIVLYTIAYFAVCGFNPPSKENPSTNLGTKSRLETKS